MAGRLLVPALALSGGRPPALASTMDPVWLGTSGEVQWSWSTAFTRPTHVGLLRARFGE